MKSSILNLGKALSKSEQKSISGGRRTSTPASECPSHCQNGCVAIVKYGEIVGWECA